MPLITLAFVVTGPHRWVWALLRLLPGFGLNWLDNHGPSERRAPHPDLSGWPFDAILYVVSPDATDRERYRGAPLGHPVLRQPLSLWQVGPSHLRVGDGLGAPPIALFRHLMLVYHEGYPAYDLQLSQTHPNGLDRFRRFIDRVRRPRTGAEQRLRRAMDWILPDPPAYLDRFVSSGGHVDRAEALEQPAPITGESAARPEVATLVAFTPTAPGATRDALPTSRPERFPCTWDGCSPRGCATRPARLRPEPGPARIRPAPPNIPTDPRAPPAGRDFP